MSKTLQDKVREVLKNSDNIFIVVRDEEGKPYQVIPQERYMQLVDVEKGLAELKKTVKAFIDNHVAYPYDEDGVAYDDEYTKEYERLLDLCEGSEDDE